MNMPDKISELAASLLIPEGRLLLGLSGGADSTALFHMLRGMNGIELMAVHVNHGLRGAESDADEAFVRDLCDRWGVPLKCCRASPEGKTDELWAREARYAFFRQVMRETGADWLVLAHHQTDQAETLLEHLLRGTGLDGLCGMYRQSGPEGTRVLRPLLELTDAELRDALQSAGYTWREDSSNQSVRYLRNRVRHELLPLMEQMAPGATARLAATATVLQGDRDHLRLETADFLRKYAGEDWISLEPLRELDPGMRARVLRTWWQERCDGLCAERNLNKAATERLTGLCGLPKGSVANLPGGTRAIRGAEHLHLRYAASPLPPEPVAWSPDGVNFGAWRLETSASAGSPGNGAISQEMPEELPAGCVIRTRRTGDRIRPFGARGFQSLQDYLVNRRVDAAWRDRIPLLCRGDQVLLVCGVGAGDIPRWEQRPGIIRLTWKGNIPWYTEKTDQKRQRRNET